jgi:hypothetical protein
MQLALTGKPVAGESQVARLAIKAAAHYATGLQFNSIGLDHAQFNRKKNRARVHVLN